MQRIHNRIQREQNNSWLKYGNRKNITERQNRYITWKKITRTQRRPWGRHTTGIVKSNAKKKYARNYIRVTRNERGRWLTSIEDIVDSSTNELEDFIKKSKERLIPAANDNIGKIRPGRKTVKTKKVEIGRKTNVWIFQATNWNCPRENL